MNPNNKRKSTKAEKEAAETIVKRAIEPIEETRAENPSAKRFNLGKQLALDMDFYADGRAEFGFIRFGGDELNTPIIAMPDGMNSFIFMIESFIDGKLEDGLIAEFNYDYLGEGATAYYDEKSQTLKIEENGKDQAQKRVVALDKAEAQVVANELQRILFKQKFTGGRELKLSLGSNQPRKIDTNPTHIIASLD